MFTLTCANCSKSFESKSKSAKYCSATCKEKARIARNRIDMVCAHCGSHFMGSPDHGARYCSLSCAARHTSVVKVLTCMDCGKQFEFHGRTRKLRCDDCWHKHRSRQTMRYRKEKDPTVAVGVGSGNNQSVHEPDSKRLEQRRRRRALYEKAKADGKAVSTYQYRSAVITGDDRCFLCGYDRHQSALVVHHKDMDRSNNRESNLVILCANCHAVIHKAIRSLIKSGSCTAESLWDDAVCECENID